MKWNRRWSWLLYGVAIAAGAYAGYVVRRCVAMNRCVTREKGADKTGNARAYAAARTAVSAWREWTCVASKRFGKLLSLFLNARTKIIVAHQRASRGQ